MSGNNFADSSKKFRSNVFVVFFSFIFGTISIMLFVLSINEAVGLLKSVSNKSVVGGIKSVWSSLLSEISIAAIGGGGFWASYFAHLVDAGAFGVVKKLDNAIGGNAGRAGGCLKPPSLLSSLSSSFSPLWLLLLTLL